MDARYQAPTLGRFLSEDPMFIQGGPANWQNSASVKPEYAALNGFVNSSNSVYLASPQNQNPYSYVNNNPIRYRDPSGKCLEDFCLAEIAFTVAVIGYIQTAYDANKAFNVYSGSGSFGQKLNSSDSINFWVDVATAGLSGGARLFGTLKDVAPTLDAVSNASGLLGDIRGNSSNKKRSVSSGVTPASIYGTQEKLSGGSGYSSSPFSSYLYNLNSNFYSDIIQTRYQTVQGYNQVLGGSGGRTAFGASIPNTNSLWVTPSGAIVTFGGDLKAAPVSSAQH